MNWAKRFPPLKCKLCCNATSNHDIWVVFYMTMLYMLNVSQITEIYKSLVLYSFLTDAVMLSDQCIAPLYTYLCLIITQCKS